MLVRRDPTFRPEVLRAHLRRRGLRVRDLMEGVGVSKPTAAKWLAGKGRPSAENLQRMSKFLASKPMLEIDFEYLPRGGGQITKTATTGQEPLVARETLYDSIIQPER